MQRSSYRIIVWGVALASLSLLCCSGGGANDDAGKRDASRRGDGGAQVDLLESRVPREISWLREGNFWMVSWSEIDIFRSWTDQGGEFDVGSYSMRLGAPETVQGMQLYPLQLDGDTEKYTPRWTHLGTDGFGDVYGLAESSQTPRRLYSEVDTTWTGQSLFTSFKQNKTIRVDRSASVVPSKYTKDKDFFEPPLTAVGYSERESNYSPGGCEYFSGYGTICTEASAGPAKGEMHIEYWSPNAGPVAMHYAYDYEDCLGTACHEKHTEQRAVVWFFGDTAAQPMALAREPDTYAEPNAIPVSSKIFTTMGDVHRGDKPSGKIEGYDARVGMEVAAQMHDWYAFEITAEQKGKTVDFYLGWNEEEIDLGFYVYAAPDNETHGFLYLGEGKLSDKTDFTRMKFLSGTYEPGRYMLGVVRRTDSEFATGYVIISASEQ